MNSHEKEIIKIRPVKNGTSVEVGLSVVQSPHVVGRLRPPTRGFYRFILYRGHDTCAIHRQSIAIHPVNVGLLLIFPLSRLDCLSCRVPTQSVACARQRGVSTDLSSIEDLMPAHILRPLKDCLSKNIVRCSICRNLALTRQRLCEVQSREQHQPRQRFHSSLANLYNL